MGCPGKLELLIFIIIVAAGIPAYGAGGKGDREAADRKSAPEGGLVSLQKLIGTDVGTLEGRGHINDVVIDREKGRVAFVSIETEGAFGEGFTRYVAPWEVLDLAGADESEWIRLHIDISKMKKASSRLSYMTERDFVREVLQHYGFKPYWYEEGSRLDIE